MYSLMLCRMRVYYDGPESCALYYNNRFSTVLNFKHLGENACNVYLNNAELKREIILFIVYIYI